MRSTRSFLFSTLWCIRNLGSQPEFLAGGSTRQFYSTEALSESQDSAGPEMSPPAGGAAVAADPASPVVLLAVHAAVRPLGAGQDAEAQLRKLQLKADPERPGRFRLGLLGTEPGERVGEQSVCCECTRVKLQIHTFMDTQVYMIMQLNEHMLSACAHVCACI